MSNPGENIKQRRIAAGLSMRALASKCEPPINHSTIQRIENNTGFTKESLDKIAKVLDCKIEDFFIPSELQLWITLNANDKAYITKTIEITALAAKERLSSRNT